MRPYGNRSSKKPISRSNDGGACGLAAEQPLAGVKESLRVDGFAFDANFVMQMRPRRSPGRAKLADDAACADGVADGEINLGMHRGFVDNRIGANAEWRALVDVTGHRFAQWHLQQRST